MRQVILLYISIFILMSSVFITPSFPLESLSILPSIDRLKWEYPPGHPPGTFEDYIANHPYSSGIFRTPVDIITLSSESSSIAILVEEHLYNFIKDNLQQYISDLEKEGYSVVLQTLEGGSPVDVKSWVKTQYENGCEGIVFIGDIPAAWAEVSGSVFPCDLFYMDLDGDWEDKDGDGVYESHTAGNGDMAPEVYIGRLYASTLKYDSEVNMINDYLEKIHLYRTGKLTQPWRGLEYIDEDWYNMDVDLDRIYGDNVTRYDFGYRTTAENYLEQLQQGWHFVQVCAHSYSGGHHFGTRPTEAVCYAHVYVYSPSNRFARLLVGADDGIKVWLNGEEVLVKDRVGSWMPDQFKTVVNLKKGWNRLLCKISQEGGDYKFSARFVDVDSQQPFNDLIYQVSDPNTHGGMPEFIRSWLINGFHSDDPDRFYSYLKTNYLGVDESTVQPQEGETMGGKQWTLYNSNNPYIDLDYAFNYPNYGVSYAYTDVISNRNQNCQLWIGYDDGARVWLNGEEILYDNRYGGFEHDMMKVNVTLHEGRNHLLVKISEWMGAHGFSARFATIDGQPVNGLTYDPIPTPIKYIGTWLVNGVYENANKSTRLSTDYLGGEASIKPSEHDSAPDGTWELGIGGYPFDIGNFFDHGDWVFSDTIQEVDPPVLFYNLFSCGPGRFTDENYLAGSYIFHTTYGLITIASSKSGSMLYFKDFTEPLGEGKSIGEAFYIWFNRQAPYQKWEKEWYYGMIVCGDPTLHLIHGSNDTPSIKIVKPSNSIYIFDSMLLPFFRPVAIGDVTVEAAVTNPGAGIVNVTFMIDGEIKSIDNTPPYSYLLDEKHIGKCRIDVSAVDKLGYKAMDSKDILVFNLDII